MFTSLILGRTAFTADVPLFDLVNELILVVLITTAIPPEMVFAWAWWGTPINSKTWRETGFNGAILVSTELWAACKPVANARDWRHPYLLQLNDLLFHYWVMEIPRLITCCYRRGHGVLSSLLLSRNTTRRLDCWNLDISCWPMCRGGHQVLLLFLLLFLLFLFLFCASAPVCIVDSRIFEKGCEHENEAHDEIDVDGFHVRYSR